MEREHGATLTHIVVLPYPLQGHINPMLQFSKRLATKGLKVTLLTPKSIVKSMKGQASSVTFEPIDDDDDDSGELITAETMEAYDERFKAMFSHGLEGLIEKNNSYGYATKLVVYDCILPWALDIAKQHGIGAAPFITQSCTIAAIFYNLYQERFTLPLQEPEVSLPSLPLLRIDDMPSFISQPGLYPFLLKVCLEMYHNFHEVNWVFCNSFDKLEEEVVSWISSQWPIKNIGPTIPSMYLDKRLKDDKNYNLSLFKPNVDACMKWLDSKDTGTVVYVSFGSMAALGEEQMEELALGLKRSNRYFLWVVRESETEKLPTKFIEETTERGLVVTWCPQLEVLSHKAIGCFMTHCGWNSTLEALSLGVPMVVMPQWSDQATNSKFVMDVWKVGIRVKVDDKGVVTREEIELCINEVMGEKGEEMKRNTLKWKKLANEALDEGGSSDKNIEEFMAKIVQI
ncbi:mogroside I-E synthase-like [Castanea sativa]|uniref:mogroside I-E synthase-like n=1 Tax=Castanea sativa TaxID=21020 RepID=UPI003F64FCE5